jgi:hypothetical protein
MRRKKNFVCDLGAFGGEDKRKRYRRRVDVVTESANLRMVARRLF